MASTPEWRAKNKDRLRENLRRWRARKRMEAIACGEIVEPKKSTRRDKWQHALRVSGNNQTSNGVQPARASAVTPQPRPEKCDLRFAVTESDISTYGNSALAFSAAFLRGCGRAAPICKPEDLGSGFVNAANSGGLFHWELSGFRFAFRIKEFPKACQFVLSEMPSPQELDMYVCALRPAIQK